ncbi:hypothetical protein [Burkholderia pseudomallei]|uniref:hypothetical protein n=1 Tax=Burkholderia pseudomallei TaxID=28450 RepID=UPI0005E4D517|nr:hypothetical protein [Burkholderia pseudomallei]CAJ3336960.1 Uncharacterised protein [Burkholderia pseudomallei]CAJ3927329.1 Uncharacterised protein [Burkholderia pseudomallei]CAJ3978922.1 Uncharacterised protein [Burkholderia pseudomallei]CAJ5703877.1 Uncharacterised protein [Burkholderia pseudomallei]CAJ7178306.1 Uncharacterised protein [Burkholderia pseudomallei]
MRYALFKALRRLLVLETVHAVFICACAYFCLDEFSLPDFLAKFGSLYHAAALMHVTYALVALDKFGSTYWRAVSSLTISDADSPSNSSRHFDSDWSSRPTVETPTSCTYDSPAAETVWINPSTGCPMLNGPGSFDTSGHTWMQ